MAIFDELKSVAKTLREAEKIPQYEQILNIQEKLLEMQNRIFDLEGENRELKSKLSEREKILLRAGVYYKIIEDGKEDGPFCTLCYDDEQKFIRMEKGNYSFGVPSDPVRYSQRCPKCKKYVR